MNANELDALIKTTRAVRVSPAERKKLRTSGAKQLSGKKPTINVSDALSHLV